MILSEGELSACFGGAAGGGDHPSMVIDMNDSKNPHGGAVAAVSASHADENAKKSLRARGYGGCSHRPAPATGQHEPAAIAALLVQGYPRPAIAVALQRALHGPFTGAKPQPPAASGRIPGQSPSARVSSKPRGMIRGAKRACQG